MRHFWGAIFNQYHASSIFLSFIHEIFLPDIEDLSVPIVCFPEAAEPHIVQKPGEPTALPCIVSLKKISQLFHRFFFKYCQIVNKNS